MNKQITPILSAIALVSLSVAAKADFSFGGKDGDLQLLDGEKLVTVLRTDYRIPCLYPLTSPSGANILRHWPLENDAPSEEKDHPHHRGLWISHGNVNGYDFWAGFDKKNATIRLDSIPSKKADGKTASFTANLTWVAGGKELLGESREHSFSMPDKDTLRLDITSTLTALKEDVVFGDTKEGTFALRVDRTLRANGPEAKATLVNSNGETNAKAWGKRADWAAYHGPDELGKPAVIAILDDPSSFRHPTHWHARDYGLLAANPFGIHDFEKLKDKKAGNHILKPGESTTLKYTVIIHHGTLESAGLDAINKSLGK
jgi:hypothetical protein